MKQTSVLVASTTWGFHGGRLMHKGDLWKDTPLERRIFPGFLLNTMSEYVING